MKTNKRSLPHVLQKENVFRSSFLGYLDRNKVAVITTEGFIKRGLFEGFGRAFLENAVFVTIKANPELCELESNIKTLRASAINTLIGVGGGSVLDSTKIFSYLLRTPQVETISEALNLQRVNKGQKTLETILFPTTSGTGAEVTPFATIWDSSSRSKFSLGNLEGVVDEVLLDPLLTCSAPYLLTLECALDTISHGLESLWNRNRTEESKKYSLTSLRLVNSSLENLLKDLQNLELRKKMQQASLNAGYAIAITRTALAHSISYPLTINFGIAHGLACSFSLVSLFDYIEEKVPYWLGIEEKKTVRDTIELLRSFNLSNLISDYCGIDEVLSVRDQMFNPQRATNFILSDSVNLNEILRRSFEI